MSAHESEHARLSAHRGVATWGERRVPLAEFRAAAVRAGTTLDAAARARAASARRQTRPDPTAVEGPFGRIAVCGGVYSNRFALAALLERARERACEAVYCLGDLGGFGPFPEAVAPLVAAGGVRVVQGNYEQALASGALDCRCGYTDPLDNRFAALSYRYTAERCSSAFKSWMGALPPRRRVRLGAHELLLVHGSPRRVNEFLFDSTTSDAYLELLLDEEGADAILVTHTGLPWQRLLPSGRRFVNVGALGRPANDGATSVWWCALEATVSTPAGEPGRDSGGGLSVALERLDYDVAALVAEMRAERLPEEFVATIATGWWTSCLEILPAKERARGRF